jgi:GR25 family glycosyltransferase involved in LPS biosynthesis
MKVSIKIWDELNQTEEEAALIVTDDALLTEEAERFMEKRWANSDWLSEMRVIIRTPDKTLYRFEVHAEQHVHFRASLKRVVPSCEGAS